jgi:DNA ligase (NAD+)
MEIEGLGEKRAQQLVANDLVQRLSDLYSLTKGDLLALEGFGSKSAQALLNEIEASRQSTLQRFLYALGIPNVGSHVAQVLTHRYKTLDELIDAQDSELQQIDEIGPTIARSIVTFFSNPQTRRTVDEILTAGVKLTNPDIDQGSVPLQGLTFVFTGELERWTRDEVQRYVERLGGRATSSVSGETDYVVAGPGAGAKLQEAKQLSTSVLSEDQFIELIQERQD